MRVTNSFALSRCAAAMTSDSGLGLPAATDATAAASPLALPVRATELPADASMSSTLPSLRGLESNEATGPEPGVEPGSLATSWYAAVFETYMRRGVCACGQGRDAQQVRCAPVALFSYVCTYKAVEKRVVLEKLANPPIGYNVGLRCGRVVGWPCLGFRDYPRAQHLHTHHCHPSRA